MVILLRPHGTRLLLLAKCGIGEMRRSNDDSRLRAALDLMDAAIAGNRHAPDGLTHSAREVLDGVLATTAEAISRILETSNLTNAQLHNLLAGWEGVCLVMDAVSAKALAATYEP